MGESELAAGSNFSKRISADEGLSSGKFQSSLKTDRGRHFSNLWILISKTLERAAEGDSNLRSGDESMRL